MREALCHGASCSLSRVQTLNPLGGWQGVHDSKQVSQHMFTILLGGGGGVSEITVQCKTLNDNHVTIMW